MKNLITRIKNYELANDEFRISLVLFVLSLTLITIENITRLEWIAVPAVGLMFLCGVFFIIAAMRESDIK